MSYRLSRSEASCGAIEIEALAKQRLADEYDSAQARGEVAGPEMGRPKSVPDGNASATVTDIGLTRKAIHEARQVRNAEKARPGIVRKALGRRVLVGVLLRPLRVEVA